MTRSRQEGRFALRRQLMGFVYTLPTIVFIVVLFLTPLVLVAKMSLSKWGLLTGDEGSHLAQPAPWEYVVSSRPLPGAPSTTLPPRTIGVLSPCGPTWWRLDTPRHNPKETLA